MNDKESAFPVFVDLREGIDYGCRDYGLSRKEYVAIHLKVPRSGDPEIDAMIRESRRAEFAKAVLNKIACPSRPLMDVMNECFYYADAMLAELEKEAGDDA
jgi:hypothetical protein